MLEGLVYPTLRDGMALSATGDFAPFHRVVAESALRGLTGYTVSDEQVAAGHGRVQRPARLPRPRPAMTALTENGVRVACLTNGSAYLTSSFLNRTGLGSLVDRVISVGEVSPLEAVADGVPVRRRGAGRPAAVAGAGRGARLGLATAPSGPG